ncbi:hypothetical protein DUY81_15160 [Acidipropionibacterium acidipropionici]|uniref:Uncharacterized protein n=2 Tax=Acidipropionibacterium acidipropionici TaxID=1748 RepID=A0AAC8YHP1_9ACTN|nr:hypothetical protein [Acidipropionibacterium acidipropionici]AMS06257.1 hypothetical protein AXH35_13215 [Acidipropionibacterium acidipropionici]AOZ47712.1 hypothetical protein A8L58_14665 [Acidipropionibacterium acidipropionici]AZP38950.1 hypothetical protein DUY81_15160 [Acidipropionibacterium acidipropionici]
MDADSGDLTPARAAEQLSLLVADRQRLSARFRTPWPIRCALGIIMATWVAQLAKGEMQGVQSIDLARDRFGAFLPTMALILLVGFLGNRRIGVRSQRMTSGGTFAVVLFGVTFGLIVNASLDAVGDIHVGAAAGLCALAFLTTIALMIAVDRATARRISRA